MNMPNYKNEYRIYYVLYIVSNTKICVHKYAEERIQQLEAQGRITRWSRFAKWTVVTLTELMAFLAIVLNVGIIHLPELEDYWQTSWVCSVPFFDRVLPRDRFELIFWVLHVCHSNTGSPMKKIDKVNTFFNMLLSKFRTSYDVGRNIAIDETMVGFCGRFAAKQYMPKKPTKWGIKAFTMADSATGYMVNILPYMGAETLDNASAEFLSLPQPARVVLDLMGPYLNRGHHLFTDRYYTSVQESPGHS